MQITHQPDGILKLAGKLNIWAVEDIREAFQSSLTGDKDLLLDLSEIVACDVAGFQLLLSARKTTEALGRRFCITSIAEAVSKTAADGGFPSPESFGAA